MIGPVEDASSWAEIALRSCLDRLAMSTLTEARRVVVSEAWVDGDDAFCVVYRPPFGAERVVGLRRRRSDAFEVEYWRLEAMTASPYIDDPDSPDPIQFGQSVADIDIGVPLGRVVEILREDADGVSWWGTLGDELPGRNDR
jgi:hypothetical protein